MFPHMPERPEEEIDYNVLTYEAKYYKASDILENECVVTSAEGVEPQY